MRRRSGRWCVGGLLLAVALISVSCSSGDGTRATSPPLASSKRAKAYQPSPPITADTVTSVDVASDDVTWVAVRVRCGMGWCLDVAHSAAGSARLGPLTPTTVPAGLETSSCSTPDCGASEVAFANRDDGYLFDPGLYVTVDGGGTWRQVPGGTVNAVVVDGTDVLRGIFGHGGCPGPCDEQLQSSQAGGATWTALPTPAPLRQPVELVLASSGTGVVYALSPANLAQGDGLRSPLYRSESGGRIWSPVPDPCPASTEVEALAASGDRVAVVCEGAPAASLTAFSNDEGRTFASAHPVPVPIGRLIALSGTYLYVASGSVSGEGAGAYGIARSRDDGVTWTRVLGGRERLELNLEDNPALTVDGRGLVDFVADPTVLSYSVGGTVWMHAPANRL